jgi:transposase-like protein
MATPAAPKIRHCPLCGMAMQASKSRSELAEFDIFRCQSCETTISQQPRPPRKGPAR